MGREQAIVTKWAHQTCQLSSHSSNWNERARALPRREDYIRSKPLLKSRGNEHTSISVELSSSRYDTETHDNSEAVVTLNQKIPQPPTFRTLEESSILYVGPYFRSWLWASHDTSARLFTKNPAKFTKVPIENDTLLFAPNWKNRCRSPKQSTRHSRFRRFSQRHRDLSTPSNQRWKHNSGIRTGPSPLHPVWKSVIPSKTRKQGPRTARAILENRRRLMSIFGTLQTCQVHHHRMSFPFKPNNPLRIATILRNIRPPTWPTLIYQQTTMR